MKQEDSKKIIALLLIALAVLLLIQLAPAPFNADIIIGQYSDGTYYLERLGNTTDSADAVYLVNLAMDYGGNILVRDGSYLITHPIVPKSNTYFKSGSNAIFYQNPPANLGSSVSLLWTTSYVENCTIDGGTWKGNKGLLYDTFWLGTGTWDLYFSQYQGIAFYGGGKNIVVKNTIVQDVIARGIDFYGVADGYIYNNFITDAGDNPITIDVGSTNCIVEWNTVTGGQDVGINTFHANNNVIRHNTVRYVMQEIHSSHWGIAAENSFNVTITDNTISGCSTNIAATYANDIYIAYNTIDGTANQGYNYGIQTMSNTYNVTVYKNKIINAAYPFGTYTVADNSHDIKFIDNEAIGDGNDPKCEIQGANILISGGSIESRYAYDGCISLRGAQNVEISYVKFWGLNGINDYGMASNGVYFHHNDFSSLTGTKVSLTHSSGVSYHDNVGYP